MANSQPGTSKSSAVSLDDLLNKEKQLLQRGDSSRSAGRRTELATSYTVSSNNTFTTSNTSLSISDRAGGARNSPPYADGGTVSPDSSTEGGSSFPAINNNNNNMTQPTNNTVQQETSIINNRPKERPPLSQSQQEGSFTVTQLSSSISQSQRPTFHNPTLASASTTIVVGREGGREHSNATGSSGLNNKMSSFKEEELHDSMTLPDVFADRDTSDQDNNNNHSSTTSNNSGLLLHSSCGDGGGSSSTNLHNSTASSISAKTSNLSSRRQRSNSTSKNHHSTGSSNNSDESSILLDVSWGSQNYDKALTLGAFDDMLAVSEGHRISGQPNRVGGGRRFSSSAAGQSMNNSNRSAAGAGGNNYLDASSKLTDYSNSIREGGGADGLDVSSKLSESFSTRDGGSRSGGTTSSKSAFSRGSKGSRASFGRKKNSKLRHLNEGHNLLSSSFNTQNTNSSHPDDPGMIPPVFKTIRRSSNSSNQQVVHVDGGGDDGANISRNLGFRANTGTDSKRNMVVLPGILKNRSMTSYRRRGTMESTSSSKSANSGGRFRRASNASNASDNMTGLQVLAASFQSARQRSSNPKFNNSSSKGGGGNNQNAGWDDEPQSPSRYVQYATTPGGDGQQQDEDRPNKFEQRGNTVPISSIPAPLSRVRSDYQMQSIRSLRNIQKQQNPDDSGDPALLDRSTEIPSFRRSNTSSAGSGMDYSDSRRDAQINESARMDESDNLTERSGGSRKAGTDDDNELVAEVGGAAYLKASRRVWAMRIAVVLTFIVVSVIVTVLTYTFFRNMERDVLKNQYLELSTILITTTLRCIEDKAASVRTLSKMYSGILGTETGDNVLRTANHPPSVIASEETLACAAENRFNWKNTWPNVTMPGYDSIGSAMLVVSQSRAAVFAPLLDGNGKDWEKYAADTALPPVKGVVSGGIRTSTSAELFRNLQGDSSSTPKLQVPAWQIAPEELTEGGIMWDYYSHPPYRGAIDRILEWKKDVDAGLVSGGYTRHGRTLSSHQEIADAGGPPGFPTELMPCSDTLLPLYLNPVPIDNPIMLTNSEGEKAQRSLASDGGDEDMCTAIFYPVYAASPFEGGSTSDVAGFAAEMFSWTDVLQETLASYGPHEVRVVLESKLDLPDGTYRTKAATYIVEDYSATFLQTGRATESQFEWTMLSYTSQAPDSDISYTIEVYATDHVGYLQTYVKEPMFLIIIAALFFLLSVIVFFVYDYFVNYRQKVVVRSAARSARIVHSLYPQFVRDSLMSSRKDLRDPIEAANTDSTQQYDPEDPSYRRKGSIKSKVSDFVDTPGMQLKRFLSHPTSSRDYDYNLCMEIGEMEPIAEIFEKTTVMLADIEGFTAWCSEREPSQVFRLLETVYREFDIEARKLGVFKVETVGDCYVAVTGLPDPRDDHAIVIAKYAVRCLLKFNVLTKRLEANLGPGTASLGMRFGLHSGPVTAGVLRGEKSRFQLFGDTINVASRMESTGEKNMIQVSQDTADLLNASGKGHWLKPREGPVSAKGKGAIKTYWLQPNRRRSSSAAAFTPSLRESMNDTGQSSEKESTMPTVSLDRALRQSWKCIGIDSDSLVAKERLIRWNAAILESYLLKIVDNRNGPSSFNDSYMEQQFVPSEQDKKLSFSDKLSEKIMFPHTAYRDDYYGVSTDIAISSEAQIELLEYVARIASMYRDVPFHNFDHASHVTMSANKLLNRVCTTFEDEEEDIASVAARTFGISADPLAQFVVVFSSLVHDVDHQGVPNAQLVKENDPLCAEFDNRSVAEKHSITIAWNILMEDRFRELQSLIFVNGDEMVRFKQLLVNTVLATDIADKERSAIGKTRWQKAFHPSSRKDLALDESTDKLLDDVNLRSLKATLVFEQIMQASDVAHTMQHWETFKKWNKRLYKELSKGFREDRGAVDPRDGWYKGEIGFFDFYIIPLAKKLKECGVFGSAASEYLDYALENRRRWEEEGVDIARIMVAENDALVAEQKKEAEKEAQNEAAKAKTTESSLDGEKTDASTKISNSQSSQESWLDGEKGGSAQVTGALKSSMKKQ